MDSVYSKFYTGKESNFGVGTWNSQPRYLTRSGSVPLYNAGNQAIRLPSCLTGYNNSYNNDKPMVSPDVLKMQMLEQKLKNFRKSKKRSN